MIVVAWFLAEEVLVWSDLKLVQKVHFLGFLLYRKSLKNKCHLIAGGKGEIASTAMLPFVPRGRIFISL